MKISNYEFDGPYSTPDLLANRAGVYAVLCLSNGNYTVIDIGESGNVRERLQTHDRKDCWGKNCEGTLYYAAHYNAENRHTIEQFLRKTFNPPCGER